jgi:predicted amidohydrolase YtcJ
MFTSSLRHRRKKPPARPPWKHAPSKPSAATVRNRLAALAVLCALPLFAHAQNVTPVLPADLIFRNAKVYPDKESGRPWAQAIAVREGNIVAIGSNAAVEREKGPATKVIDLGGRVVLPAFNDAHVHLMAGGLALSRVELGGAASIAVIQERLRMYVAANSQKRWIIGQGWDASALAEKRQPTRDDIDAAISDKPVMLWHSDSHRLLLNSKALGLLHIDRDSPNPPGGDIAHDAKGEPTGILTESAAMEVARKVDNPSSEELRQALLLAQDQAQRFGVASLQGGPFRGEEELRALADAYTNNQLRIRYALWGELEKPQEFLALKEKYKHLPDEWVKFDAVKGFVDGVLGSRTAALLEPYSDDATTRGEPLYTQERLNELVVAANRLGIPVALHAIGDRAVSMAVTAFAASKQQLFNSRLRNRIEHAEVVPPFIYPKVTENNIVISMQPSHLSYETMPQSYNEARLGGQRSKQAFAAHAFLAARSHLAFGTDWPVMPLNPMIGLFSAVYRQHFDGKPSGGWQPAQRISMEQAIEAYTLGSAFATREEHVKGSLREGKYADLVVLEKDPFKVAPRDLLKVPVYMTIIGGRIVFDGSMPQLRPEREGPTGR